MDPMASAVSECDCTSVYGTVKTHPIPAVDGGMALLPMLAENLHPKVYFEAGHQLGPGAMDSQASNQRIRRFVCAECVFAKKTGSVSTVPFSSCLTPDSPQ